MISKLCSLSPWLSFHQPGVWIVCMESSNARDISVILTVESFARNSQQNGNITDQPVVVKTFISNISPSFRGKFIREPPSTRQQKTTSVPSHDTMTMKIHDKPAFGHISKHHHTLQCLWRNLKGRGKARSERGKREGGATNGLTWQAIRTQRYCYEGKWIKLSWVYCYVQQLGVFTKHSPALYHRAVPPSHSFFCRSQSKTRISVRLSDSSHISSDWG